MWKLYRDNKHMLDKAENNSDLPNKMQFSSVK